MVNTERLAGLIAADFHECQLDLSLRRSPPAGVTWDTMPAVEAARQLRAQGASDSTVRVFLTFVAAMNRARDATTLWHAGVVLFGSHPEVFDTRRAAALPLSQVSHLLANSGVSQRHGPDARAWHRIAESLATVAASPVHGVIHRGAGDAQDLLKDVKTKDHAGRPRFPMLRGPKIGPMWVRMLAEPGGAAITRIDTIPVAVDVHVRRVTENLRVTATRDLRLKEATPRIQSAWKKAVVPALIPGPARIAGTCAALDPALWAFGKYGCSHCETVGVRVPIGRACDYCQLRSDAGADPKLAAAITAAVRQTAEHDNAAEPPPERLTIPLDYTGPDAHKRSVFKPADEHHGCSVLIQPTFAERFLRDVDLQKARVTLVVERD